MTAALKVAEAQGFTKRYRMHVGVCGRTPAPDPTSPMASINFHEPSQGSVWPVMTNTEGM